MFWLLKPSQLVPNQQLENKKLFPGCFWGAAAPAKLGFLTTAGEKRRRAVAVQDAPRSKCRFMGAQRLGVLQPSGALVLGGAGAAKMSRLRRWTRRVWFFGEIINVENQERRKFPFPIVASILFFKSAFNCGKLSACQRIKLYCRVSK